MRQPRFLQLSVATSLFAALLIQPPAGAQRPPRVDPAPLASFTPEQAAQGKIAYAAQCGSCHGKNLSGSEFATPLNGTAFSLNWGGKPADALFTFIRTRMPPAAIGSLTPDATAGLLAYLLQVNGAARGRCQHPGRAANPAQSSRQGIPNDAAVTPVAAGAQGVRAQSAG
jgi:mono/diheme cytochrome c family protein